MLELYVGNKNYSSWSLRPWLLLQHFGVPFREHAVSVGGLSLNPAIVAVSASGRVPALHLDGFQVWDSLAIAETLAEQYPQMWPTERLARARARSISAEMHAGFTALRGALPMNLKLRLRGATPTAEVQRDIDRIVSIWQEARSQFGAGGPWLFGDFSIADAMYAPVACRFDTYNIPLPPVAAAWRDAVLAHPALQAWRAAALGETQAHAHYDRLAEAWGGPRE